MIPDSTLSISINKLLILSHCKNMYWLSALPLGGGDPNSVWKTLESATQRHHYSQNFAFHIPEGFKIGTLDSLLGLSDDLVKVNTAIEATVNKIRRQLYEVQEELPEDQRRDITIEGIKPEVYLQTFAWDEAKYPSRRPPKDTVAAIMETVQALDEDLKVCGCVIIVCISIDLTMGARCR